MSSYKQKNAAAAYRRKLHDLEYPQCESQVDDDKK